MTLCRGFDGLLRLQPPIHRPITVSWGLDLVDYQIRAENTVGNAPRNPQATATLYHEKKKGKDREQTKQIQQTLRNPQRHVQAAVKASMNAACVARSHALYKTGQPLRILRKRKRTRVRKKAVLRAYAVSLKAH